MKKRGFTVVELVVAMSVSAIIVGSIVALLVFTQRYSQFRAADIPARDEMKNVETVIKDFFYKFDSSRYPAPSVEKNESENKSTLTFGDGRIVVKKNISEEQNYSYSLALEQKNENRWEHQSQVVSTRIQSVTFEQDGNIVRVDITYNDSHGNERTYSFLLIKRSANTTTEPTG
ncbi:MAG: prepilin-type N-terminal cleavage/methylation domain-containing protein [Eubacteriales bacterium]|nr:prepilin-type N-terminal cleavage/methylation domain-containing protein [Eubacteriales bacterium]